MTNEAREAALDIVEAFDVAAADSHLGLTPEDAECVIADLWRVVRALRMDPVGVAAELEREIVRWAERRGVCPDCNRVLDRCTCEPDTMPEDAEIVWSQSRGVR